MFLRTCSKVLLVLYLGKFWVRAALINFYRFLHIWKMILLGLILQGLLILFKFIFLSRVKCLKYQPQRSTCRCKISKFSLFFILKVHSCKLYNNKFMILSTQITNTVIFAFIAVLVFKLFSRKVFFYKQKRQ